MKKKCVTNIGMAFCLSLVFILGGCGKTEPGGSETVAEETTGDSEEKDVVDSKNVVNVDDGKNSLAVKDDSKTDTEEKKNSNNGNDNNTGSISINSNSNTSTDSSKSSSSGSSDSSKTEEVASTHTHTWEPVYTTVHHDAVTQQVKVVDEEAYTEYVAQYEDHSYMVCKLCGKSFYTSEEYNSDEHTCHKGSFYSVSNLVYVGDEIVQHPEVSHYETVTVSEAYDEEVITGYKCSCGATK